MKRGLTILLLLALVSLVIGIATENDPISAPDYASAVAAVQNRGISGMVAGSDVEKEAVDRFKQLWADFQPDRLRDGVPLVYREDVWFNDTVKTITNRAALAHYLAETAGRVASCEIEFLDFMRTENGYFVRWKMTIMPDAGEPDTRWVSFGITHLIFDASGRVALHQDYWDSASGLFDHLPVIGWILRNVRARL